MLLPKSITRLIESFEKLPGIGPKTAQRLVFCLLHVPQQELDDFSNNLKVLKTSTKLCRECRNIDEIDPCRICQDPRRNKMTICVVEQPLDLIALENTRKFNGVYHVLHGAIAPLNNIGPDEIYIKQLLKRALGKEIKEIILATNPTMEGEATAMYIAKQLKIENGKLKITRIGRGLPTGADIEYADELTLQRAMEGRQNY